MLHPLVDDRAYMPIRQRVEHGLAVPPVFNQFALFEHLKLVRDR